MKKIIILSTIILCFFATHLIAQEQLDPEKKKRHELNLGISGLLSRIIPIYSPWDFVSTYAYQNPDLGLGYKYHLSNLAVRLNFDLGLKNNSIESDGYMYDYSFFNSKTKLGFEYESSIEKFNIFYGFNLVWGYSETKSETIYNAVNFPWSTNSKYFLWEKTSGVSPIIGVKYQLNKSISISSEASFDLSYVKNRSNYYYSTSTSISSGSGIELDINPIGLLSVNIHL